MPTSRGVVNCRRAIFVFAPLWALCETAAAMCSAPQRTFDLDAKNAELETATPQEIVRFAWETWGPDAAMQSSFGADSASLLHLATRVVPDIRVLFLETHYHFPETLRFKEELTRRLHLNIVELQVLKGREWFLREHGDDLNRRDPALCCQLNKVEPMADALRRLGIRAYLTGIRRGQSETRRHFKVLTVEDRVRFDVPGAENPPAETVLRGHSVIKVAPILTWSRRQVED
jgi:3'-phosphoadenosine 5'-phosphosulfate sulfotransferase (PAPS reductase)/FAD synthetase